ncbi:dicarboxylate/amino acid:cation symporter [Cellvibrio sp. pealriver]|uniref:dicarboxylate/amino acid:cation symporter n=1 Tax=Cellvibrio sp. pealriver TaxID=1622269 RepID=UPI00066FD3AC|nr:dicarboxylate/amino acid:cation symporter [Cellvibrio sp. pealriver]
MSLTNKILLGMLLGVLVGVIFNLLLGVDDPQTVPTTSYGQWIQTVLINGVLDTIGQIFVASLKLLVVPLVFVSLVCGAASLGGHNRMGALATKTLLLYLMTTAMAIALAMGVAVFIQPGAAVDMALSSTYTAPPAPSIKQTFLDIFPSNPVQAMAEGNMLQVIVFSILFGIAISRTGGEIGSNMKTFFEHLNEVVLKMMLLLMQLAPYGVFCLLAKLFANIGFAAITDLAKYFFTVLFVLLLHGFVVYGLLLKILSGLSPIIFFKKMWKVAVFAFSTASSNATLPVTMRTVEHDLGVDNKVSSFSVPLGATINMDGTAIMQGVATVFIAQVYNIDIGVSGYLMVILTATLASIGTAGVPSVGLVMLAMVLQSVGLPVEGIALIIGVDRLLDMVRTAVNVTGDATVSVIVAKSENMVDKTRYDDMKLNAEIDPV